MRVLLPIFLAALVLAGFSLGDEMPVLNAYELLRASGLSFLPPSGSHYIVDQAKLGGAALSVAWIAWFLASVLLVEITKRLWSLIS